jgi:hypothetical protein
MRITIGVASLGLLLISGTQAAPLTSGVYARLNCAGAGAVFVPCTPSQPTFFVADNDFTDRDGVASVQLGLESEPLGIVIAHSSGFSGASLTPTISGYSFSLPDASHVSTAAAGFQRYTFVGPPGSVVEVEINAVLSYSAGASTGALGVSLFDARIVAFRMQGDVLDPDQCIFGPNILLPCLVLGIQPGLIDYQEDVFSSPAGEPTPEVLDGVGTMSLTISGMAGDNIFVGGFLGMFTTESATFVDARTTLTLEFDNPSLVAPAFTRETFVPAPAPGTEIRIDIFPLLSHNKVIPRIGIIPVTVFGSQSFDALQIDARTLKFGSGGAHAIPWLTLVRDINRDGFTDVIATFVTKDTGISCGDTSATLEGRTFATAPFHGTDSVTPIGCRARTQ